jgi:hypothetical protein
VSIAYEKPWKDCTAQLDLLISHSMGMADTGATLGASYRTDDTCTLAPNKTRQGYARERILKPAGYFFVRRVVAAQGLARSSSWQR